jgi:hypothetical protein
MPRTLASAMGIAMAMAMKAKRRTAEAAIGRGATFNKTPVRTAGPIWNAPGSAIDPRHKTHRHHAGGRGTHHGQDDTARTFHGITCLHGAEQIRALTPKRFGSSSLKPADTRAGIEADLRPTGKAKPSFHSICGKVPAGLFVSRRRKNAMRTHAQTSRSRPASRRRNRNRTTCQMRNGLMNRC